MISGFAELSRAVVAWLATLIASLLPDVLARSLAPRLAPAAVGAGRLAVLVVLPERPPSALPPGILIAVELARPAGATTTTVTYVDHESFPVRFVNALFAVE